MPHKTGQKLQSTVRFEKSTYEIIEMISERDGLTFAETVRKIIETSLQKSAYSEARSTHSGE